MGKKRFGIQASLIFVVVMSAFFFMFRRNDTVLYDTSRPKSVQIVVDGFPFEYSASKELSVGALLDGSGIDVAPGDGFFPSRETPLSPGMRIIVSRSKAVSVKIDGQNRMIDTNAKTIKDALRDGNVSLRDEDIVAPDRDVLLTRFMKVVITRVEIKEESVEKKIAYETITKNDDTLSWRKKITNTKGVTGIRTYQYRVSYHDGKEVSRKLLGSGVTKDPVSEVVVQGSFVKVGKAASGAGTWYSFTGKLAAASLSLPLGSYARVTNVENDKSVIVVINDRGPYGKGRIIDLDRVAFERISSAGAGIIAVKVEPVLN